MMKLGSSNILSRWSQHLRNVARRRSHQRSENLQDLGNRNQVQKRVTVSTAGNSRDPRLSSNSTLPRNIPVLTQGSVDIMDVNEEAKQFMALAQFLESNNKYRKDAALELGGVGEIQKQLKVEQEKLQQMGIEMRELEDRLAKSRTEWAEQNGKVASLKLRSNPRAIQTYIKARNVDEVQYRQYLGSLASMLAKKYC